MPTYEYACRSCGQHRDVVQSFEDEPLTTCPSCGGPLRKVFGNIAIAFKGSGFYKTDNRSGGAGAATAPRPTSESDSSSTKEKGGDSKVGSDSSSGSSDSGKSSSDTGSAPAAAPSTPKSPPKSPPQGPSSDSSTKSDRSRAAS